MYLSDWQIKTFDEKAETIKAAVADISQEKKRGLYGVVLCVVGVTVFDQFIKEVIAARELGQYHYSAQRIYEYLSHVHLKRKLRFQADVQAAGLLAEVSTRIFPQELKEYFDDQGVVTQ